MSGCGLANMTETWLLFPSNIGSRLIAFIALVFGVLEQLPRLAPPEPLSPSRGPCMATMPSEVPTDLVKISESRGDTLPAQKSISWILGTSDSCVRCLEI